MLNRIKGGKLGDLMLSKLAWLKLKDGIPQGKRMGPSRFVMCLMTLLLSDDVLMT